MWFYVQGGVVGLKECGGGREGRGTYLRVEQLRVRAVRDVSPWWCRSAGRSGSGVQSRGRHVPLAQRLLGCLSLPVDPPPPPPLISLPHCRAGCLSTILSLHFTQTTDSSLTKAS